MQLVYVIILFNPFVSINTLEETAFSNLAHFSVKKGLSFFRIRVYHTTRKFNSIMIDSSSHWYSGENICQREQTVPTPQTCDIIQSILLSFCNWEQCVLFRKEKRSFDGTYLRVILISIEQ